MRNLLLSACTLLLASIGFAQVSIQLSSPTTSSTSPVHVEASASSSHPITGWQVYLDGKSAYSAGATSNINTSLSTATGSHQLVVRAWDSTGAYGSQTVQVNVSTASAATALTVSVASPTAYSTVGNPFTLQASASGPQAITGWQAYLDGKSVASAGATKSINASVSAATGTHLLVVRAWDTSGAYADQTLQVNVSSASGTGGTTPPPSAPSSGALPKPPSTAKVWTNIEQMTTGWTSCETAACAGGNGGGTLWQAFNQTTPSMDGNSMEIYHDGKFSNALWWHKMGANDNATNMLWDFYVLLDSASLTNAQALEYDSYQFVGGYNYMVGTECNYAAGVWDTWNEVTQKWLHTTVPCKKFTPNTWHHIQMYVTTNHSAHTYTYKTLVVDGVVYNLNQTQPAKYLAWADNIGVQWQLDVNATGGGYHEWVDKATFTVW